VSSDQDRHEPNEYGGSPNLFRGSACQSCALFGDCGGSSTAPCGCAWDPESDWYHDCKNCPLICRARTEVPSPYHKVMNGGLSLSEVSIGQDRFLGRGEEKPRAPFPLLIPFQTAELPEGTRLPLEWTGVRLSELVNKGSGEGSPARLLASENIREELRVSPDAKVLALLNGKDDRLAALWGMDRSELYDRAGQHGIEAITGPTFSISSEREGDPRTPAAQNVIMQKRHHKVLAEIGAQTTATPIPNLYWRGHRDREKWAEWLEENQVQVVYRDFTMTRQKENFRPELAGLIEILGRVGRPMHVLAGVGVWKAEWTIRRLGEEGHTCSVVTSDPIYTSVVPGKRMERVGTQIEKTESDAPTLALAKENLEVVEAYLQNIASELSPYEGGGVANRVHKGQDRSREGREAIDGKCRRQAATSTTRRSHGPRASEEKS
jgi:hypothetical protein